MAELYPFHWSRKAAPDISPDTASFTVEFSSVCPWNMVIPGYILLNSIQATYYFNRIIFFESPYLPDSIR